MRTLTLKHVPDHVYDRLRERATRHRRSINGEAILCLEIALGRRAPDVPHVLDRARDLRSLTLDAPLTDERFDVLVGEGRP